MLLEFTVCHNTGVNKSADPLSFKGSVTVLHVKAFKSSNLWPDNQNQILVYLKNFVKRLEHWLGNFTWHQPTKKKKAPFTINQGNTKHTPVCITFSQFAPLIQQYIRSTRQTSFLLLASGFVKTWCRLFWRMSSKQFTLPSEVTYQMFYCFIKLM